MKLKIGKKKRILLRKASATFIVIEVANVAILTTWLFTESWFLSLEYRLVIK